jgi:hypothetical protein
MNRISQAIRPVVEWVTLPIQLREMKQPAVEWVRFVFNVVKGS